jgi:CPA2 family monovalent cation:H+ antiporter-2
VVIVGYGRVGSTIGRTLDDGGVPFVVIESDRRLLESLRDEGIHCVFGDASRAPVLAHAGVARARMLVIAAPGAFQTRAILDAARKLNPSIDTVVRTHSSTEQRWLEARGVGLAVMGERELALGMARYALGRIGVVGRRAERLLERLGPVRS